MEETPKFNAYCCGLPMKPVETETHIKFKCATGEHGRWFVMAKTPQDPSYCSHGKIELSTADLGAVRLYSCPDCGARYSIFVDGIKFEADIQGINAEEVNKVGRETISTMWDVIHRMGEPTAPFNCEVEEIKTKLDILQSMISQLDADGRSALTNMINHMDQNQLSMVQCILAAIDSNYIPESDMNDILMAVQQSIKEIRNSVKNFNWFLADVSRILDSPKIDQIHKLKVSIPIIPYILSYEEELALTNGVNIKAFWSGLKAKIRCATKTKGSDM